MGMWSEAVDAMSGSGINIWSVVFIIVGVGVGLLLLGFVGFRWYFKKRWNIRAEIKLPRSDGTLTNAEWGKALYDAKKGVCFVKRPGIMERAIAVKPFDIRKYIQGNDIITFIQVGPEDFRPVLNKSWEEFEEDEPMKDSKGKEMLDEEGNLIYEKAAMMNIRINPSSNKAWYVGWTTAAKQAYSLKSFFSQFQTPIAIAIVIIAVFVGFAIMWTKLGSVCG